MLAPAAFAPGARVVIRDEEWMIRRIQPARSGSALTVIGLSELVRNQEALFLTELDDVRVLRPEEVELVRDDSTGHRQARLYLEALLRRTPPTEPKLVVGHRAALHRTPYQWEPAVQALGQLRPRILIADGVGLGKTIEVGILLSELIRRGRGQRILVVALKSILAQFQEELWARFTLPLVRLDSVGIQRVQAKIPSNQNPFHYFDKVIVSIDTLKKNERYARYLDDCQWDVVVVDECQNVATRGTSASQRARLARLLSRNTDALVLTSATPHDGRASSFASLIRLLEPTAIADETKFSAADVKGFFIRRFQKDVRHTSVGHFHEREVGTLEPHATAAEEAVLRLLDAARFETIGRSQETDALFRTLLLKAWLSSPAACLSTVRARLGQLDRHEDKADRRADRIAHDREVLTGLEAAVAAIAPADQSKLQCLFAFLAGLGWAKGRVGERAVIFSERIDTLRFLEEQLAARFGVATTRLRKGDLAWEKGEIAVFHGGLPDQDQYGLVHDFSNKNGTIRLLLGSDAASEGLNLHHACHHLVHYDIPWSLITLEQRNGRIDRFGQESRPVLRYLLTRPVDAALRADHRILERLIEKETEAVKNLGDVAWLMNLHDARKEEARIAAAIERGESPDSVFSDPTDDEGDDWLQALLETGAESPPDPPEPVDPPSLFADDLDWAREGFAQLGLDGRSAPSVAPGSQPVSVEWVPALKGFRLHPPDDLKLRYRYLPPELRQGSGEVRLTTDRARVMDSWAKARDTESGWPEWELFWEQHPVAEWLNDRVLATFRRHEAPLVEVGAGLAPGEAAYVFQSTLANQRSQPVIVDWTAVVRNPLGLLTRQPFEALAASCGLHGPLPNSGRELPSGPFTRDLPRVVTLVHDHLDKLRKAHEHRAVEVLRPAVRRLRTWKAAAKDHIAHQLETRTLRQEVTRQLELEAAEIDRVYEARERWITDVVRVSPTPYVRLAAVLCRPL